MFATISGDYGYSAEEAQSQRDALIAPEITLRDVLDQFRAFADEFENFDIEEFEEEHCGNTAHTLENLTLHSEDTNPHLNRITSHMASTLDDAALNLGNVGSQLQDVDSRSDEVALPLDGTTSPADDRESYRDIDSSSDGTVSSSDEMAAAYVEMASVLNDLDVDFDDDSSSDEEGLFSDKGDLSIVQKNIVTRTELPPPAQQLMWMQQIDTDGSIVGLITEDLDFHIAYEFYLPPDGRMPLEVLTYFSDVISTLRNLTKVMFEFLTTMSDIHSDDSRIMWLPALLRCGIRDIIQENFRGAVESCRYPLFSMAPDDPDGRLTSTITSQTRKYLESFLLVSGRPNEAELRLFSIMNNSLVPPEYMIHPVVIRKFFEERAKDLRGYRTLKTLTLKSFEEIAEKTHTRRRQTDQSADVTGSPADDSAEAS